MERMSLIIAALTAGVVAGVRDTADVAIKDAYARVEGADSWSFRREPASDHRTPNCQSRDLRLRTESWLDRAVALSTLKIIPGFWIADDDCPASDWRSAVQCPERV